MHDIKVLTFISNEMARQVKNNLQFVKNCSGEDLSGRFTDSPKKGETISFRKSARLVGRDGENFQEEDYIERLVDVTVQQTAGVDLVFTNRQLMLNIDGKEEIAERVVKPAAELLANKIDRAALALAMSRVYNYVGTPGTVPTALKTYNQARAAMSWEGCTNEGHSMLITPDMQVEAVDAGKTFFTKEAEDQYETGLLGRHSGAKVYECQNLIANTIGALGGTPLVNGTTADGASQLVTDGWTAAIATRLKKTNRFTVDNVYAVNPWTRERYNTLRRFVVTADAASDGSGNMTIPFYPPMQLTGPYQNIDALPVDNANINVVGAANTVTPQGLRFHRDAFVFGTLDQPSPDKAVIFSKVVTVPGMNLKIRYIRDWETRPNRQIDRMDVVWYFGVALPEFASAIYS